MRTRLFTLVVLTACVLAFTGRAGAQTINGNIVGIVTDEKGAAVAGANVTTTNTGTGATRTATTNGEGIYNIVGLPVGEYSIKVESPGFAAGTAQVSVSVGQDSKADFQLKAGGVTEQVNIIATAGPLLETTQSQVTKTVEQTRIQELPGRNSLTGLALLNPGVLPNQNGRPGSGFVVNGNRTRSNNFTIDGANNNDQSLSIPRQNLPPEDLQEFQIITNTPEAEFGRNAGSYVNQITRSGTNNFHGTGWWAWDGNGLDALTTSQERTFKANKAAGLSDYAARHRARSVTVDNIFGGNIGGPIKHDHTFFFGSYDREPFRTTISSASRAALDQASLDFLNANRNRFNPAAVDFILKTFPVANDPTFAGGTQAASTATVRDIKGAAVGTVTFRTFNRTLSQGLPYGTIFDRYLGKINTKINNKDQLSFRYLLDQSRDPGQPASLPGLELGQNTRNQSFTINDVYAISPTLINEARFTYSRRKINFPENFTAFASGNQLTVSGALSAFNGGNANFPQSRIDNVYEWTENMSKTKGNHNFKWGANVLRYQLNSFFAPNSRGSVTYSSLSNFLNDVAQLIQKANGNFNVNAITYENSFFAQDDWRVRPDLTLNLGLRYEYVTVPFGYFSNAKPDVNNFGPRVGFAWNPKSWFDGRFVLRGGFGISYDQVFQNILLNVSRNYPRTANFAISCTGCAPFNGYNQPSLAALNADPSTIPASQAQLIDIRLFSPNQRIKQPMSYQWNTGVQYQFGRDYVFKAEYIGTAGRNLVREVETNYGFATASGLGNGQRLDPTRGSVVVGQGIASSIYHSGQFTLEKRLGNLHFLERSWGGLNLNVNYTYSSFISESDDVLGGTTNRTVPADPRNIHVDRARSGFDQPHRFVASYVWQSPEVFQGSRWLNRLASGWEISGVTTLASGTPYSILSATNGLGILPSGQLSTVSTSQRVQLVNPSATGNTFTVGQVQTINGQRTLVWPDPTAHYGVIPDNAGFFGNLGANTARTGSTKNTNLSAVKNFRTFGENQRLQLRAEIFDVFNHRNFTVIPTNTLSASTNPLSFNNLGLTNVVGRQFLFGARYFF
ncbi:MAG: TonB-dependent receptor [Acidobacteriota bacterium]|nr:TonB-dependent receptor [Acidobacteriota bacterium]